MKTKYDRGAIMRRAHALKKETGESFGACLSAAWREAKEKPTAGRYSPPALPPQRLPLEAIVMDTIGLVRRISRSKIEIGLKIHAAAGIRITDAEGQAESIGKDFSAAIVLQKDFRKPQHAQIAAR
jgi:hypothetical protein